MEHKSIIVDSSFLVALYITDDSQHHIAGRIARQLSGIEKTLLIHPYIIQEVSTILTYRMGTALARRFLDDLAASDSVVIPAVNIQHDMEFFKRADKKMSFADTTLVRLSKQMNIPILSFDSQIIALVKNI